MTHAPVPTPESAQFWEGTRAGELRLQRCQPCDRFYFVPRPFCPYCASDDVRWEQVSGRGVVRSCVIVRRAIPGGRTDVPFALGLVELEQGPRMLAEIVDIEVDVDDPLDLEVEARFVPCGEEFVTVFRPSGAQ